MSSIDKYVEEAGREIDQRVRVHHSGNQLVGTINGREVFRLPDRYGFLHDDEKQLVQNAVRRYLVNDAEERRRREEERRRQEEERRRREEARLRAISNGKAAIDQAKSRAAAYYDGLLKGQVSLNPVDPEVSSAFDISEIVNQAQGEVHKIQGNMEEEIRRQKALTLRMFDDSKRGLDGATNEQDANQRASRAAALHYHFDNAEFTNKVNKVQSQLSTALASCEKMLKKLLDFDRKYNSPTSKSVVQRVKNIQIRTTKDLEQVSEIIAAAIGSIEDEKEKQEFQNELNELKVVNEELVKVNLLCDVDVGSKYEIPKFETEISSIKERLMSMRENLLSAEFTSMQADQLLKVENFLKEVQEGEVAYHYGEALANELEKVHMMDERLVPQYNRFKEALKNAEELGLPVDMEFDPLHPESQLDALVEQMSDKTIENEMQDTWERGMATHALMDGLGYDLLGMKENNGMLSYIYAREDLKGVVMQVNVTADGVRRKLVGVKVGDQESGVEEVKAAARVLEEKEEPAEFMRGYNMLYENAEIKSDCGFSDTEGIEEAIIANGVYDLDEEGKADVYQHQIMKENNISVVFKAESLQRSEHKQSINVVLNQEVHAYRQQKCAQMKALYMSL